MNELIDATDPRGAGSYGDADVNDILDAFNRSFNTTTTTKYDRWAAKRLANKHGAANVIQVIQALAGLGHEKYCPTTNNVAQIEQKWVSVLKFLHNHRKQEIEDL